MAYLILKRGYQRKKPYLALRIVEYKGIGRFKKRVEKEKYVRTSFLVIRGGRDTGKSRETYKLYRWSKELWGVDGVWLRATESLENFFKRAGLRKEELRGLSQAEKISKLIEACKGKTVYIDDIDKVEGRLKKQVIKSLIRVSKGGAVSCENEKKIDVGIVAEIRRKQGLKKWESLKVLDIGRKEEEIKDIGMMVAVFLILGIALIFGFHEALLGALGLRYLVKESERS